MECLSSTKVNQYLKEPPKYFPSVNTEIPHDPYLRQKTLPLLHRETIPHLRFEDQLTIPEVLF
jgi:hypothetical protein